MKEQISNVGKAIGNGVKSKIGKTIVGPFNEMVDENLADITTTIGSFIIRKVRGKFQRSISFRTGNYYDDWMEEALYGILYQYNQIKRSPKLELTNKRGMNKGTGMYYRLDVGAHNLKYRKWNILLCIQEETSTAQIPGGTRVKPHRMYTIITYDLDPDFVTLFEKDMVAHRNSLLKIKADSPMVTIYQDYHESDGFTYWEKRQSIYKRRLNTIYLPHTQKKEIVDTVNEFFGNKEYYKRHGISHNLKILLYGLPGVGKDSICKMIASEWNRNIYYVSGGKDGKYIPNAIVDEDDDINYPLYIISDIDKYPFLINEPDIDMTKEGAKEETMKYKMLYGNMLNALDGILSGEDKIIIMTTNHFEKFGDAFLRPGRINLCMEIGPVNEEVFREFTKDYYGKILPEDIKLKVKNVLIADLQKDVVFLKMGYDEFIKKYLK